MIHSLCQNQKDQPLTHLAGVASSWSLCSIVFGCIACSLLLCSYGFAVTVKKNLWSFASTTNKTSDNFRFFLSYVMILHEKFLNCRRHVHYTFTFYIYTHTCSLSQTHTCCKHAHKLSQTANLEMPNLNFAIILFK